MIGTSAAFHLAEAGADVVLVERAELASGSTSKAAGGVRAQFSDPLNIAIGLRSLEAFERFAERPGAEIDLHRVGYLFLLDREDDVRAFEASVALQNELGVPSRFVSLDEAADCSPLAGLDGVLAATFSPLDGHAAPEAVVQGYAAGARGHGATIATGCELTGIDVRDGSDPERADGGRRHHHRGRRLLRGRLVARARRDRGRRPAGRPGLARDRYTAPVPGLPERSR